MLKTGPIIRNALIAIIEAGQFGSFGGNEWSGEVG
jgi:hypothetical protein